MYRELGFIRVWGSQSSARNGGVEYAYLIYPHRPVIAYAPQTGRLLGEYCVEFPDDTRPYGTARLPDSDDVLAKWMALTGDEGRYWPAPIFTCQADRSTPHRSTRDLWRLSRWEQARMRDVASTLGVAPAPRRS